VILYDGSYHDWDSNDMSFRWGPHRVQESDRAGEADDLEPVMAVEITVPDDFAGSIMGDSTAAAAHPGMDNKPATRW